LPTYLSTYFTAAEGGDDTAISILERGEHRLPFDFALPEQCLPCSFESRVGTVRYYLRVIIDIPYASPPQGLKYFTVIGPHIDSNDDKYAVSTVADGLFSCFTSVYFAASTHGLVSTYAAVRLELCSPNINHINPPDLSN